MNLCGEKKNGVLVERGVRGTVAGRIHVEIHVGARGGEIPEGQRAVAVQHCRDRVRVRADPRHIRGRRETPDLERAVRVRDQLPLEMVEIDLAVGVLVDGDHVGDRLAQGSSFE